MNSATIWRIEKAAFAKTVREGDGARLYGGRWNSPGLPAIYCAGSLALGMLEILVHVQTSEEAGTKRLIYQLELDVGSCEEVSAASLPRHWRSALNTEPCRRVGDAWLRR